MILRAIGPALVLTTSLLGVTAACNRAEAPTPAEAPAAVPEATDDRLATHVQARYQSDPAISASEIAVDVREGVVTLRGVVRTDDARRHAEQVAAQVEGVRSVQNELQVRPEAAAPGAMPPGQQRASTPASAAVDDQRAPAWITTKIQAQYFVDSDLKPWNIDVTTRADGTVVLRGEVDEATDRDEATRIAQATDGVTRVENELRVRGESGQQRATGGTTEDAWITAKVQAKYFVDPDVKGRRIDVDTRQGVVTLTGEVSSDSERRQAIAIARNTDGVTSVTDQLKVQAAAATGGDEARSARSNVSTVEDAWITTKLQAKFFLDGDIKARDIDVDTRRGVVTLKGSVASDAEKQMATAIARDTEGVTRVVNELTVAK